MAGLSFTFRYHVCLLFISLDHYRKIETAPTGVMIRIILIALMMVFPTCAISQVTPACHPAHDHAGRIHRSHAVTAEFQRKHPCPSNGQRRGHCPGYIVDHIQPLCACGPDATSNMQWQTVADATVKDRLERRECRFIKEKVVTQ